ncbi:hypothetical protein D3C81_1099050 [compost metagenome]
MRSVAPERLGKATSQNSWSVVKLKPMRGRLIATAENNTQTEKASSKAGIEMIKLRVATRWPVRSQ